MKLYSLTPFSEKGHLEIRCQLSWQWKLTIQDSTSGDFHEISCFPFSCALWLSRGKFDFHRPFCWWSQLKVVGPWNFWCRMVGDKKCASSWQMDNSKIADLTKIHQNTLTENTWKVLLNICCWSVILSRPGRCVCRFFLVPTQTGAQRTNEAGSGGSDGYQGRVHFDVMQRCLDRKLANKAPSGSMGRTVYLPTFTYIYHKTSTNLPTFSIKHQPKCRYKIYLFVPWIR